MNRRLFLGIVGTSGIAFGSGCLSETAGEGFDISSTPLSAADASDTFGIEYADLSDSQTEVVDEIRDSGQSTRFEYDDPWHFSPPFEGGEYVVVEDSFYRIEKIPVDPATVTTLVLQAEEVSEDAIDEDVEPYDSLYEMESQEVVHIAITRTTEEDPGTYVFHGDYLKKATPQLNPEVEHEYVKFEGDYFQLSVTETDVEIDQSEYSWTEVALDEQEFKEALQNNAHLTVISSDDLSDNAKKICDGIFLDEDSSGDYWAEKPYSDAEEKVLGLFEADDYELVEYEGSHYVVEVRFWID